ncbi:MAG: hypothetical protein EOP41_06085, partial [Sphingobacteriaceae bacterium]
TDATNNKTSNNKIAGVWKLLSAYLNTGTERIPILGANPSGLLILTPGMNFSVTVNNPDTKHFKSGDRMNGTPQENQLATQNSLALYGTYRTDELGEFLDQHIQGLSFPNWNGLSRGREVLRLTAEGNRITENIDIPGAGLVEIIWNRVE